MSPTKYLKTGGVAVHTTEFNVHSNNETLTEGPNVIYRQRDLLALSESLTATGLNPTALNFDVGDHPYDIEFDTPPYMRPDKRHLKLELSGHICTSFLLIIEKPLVGEVELPCFDATSTIRGISRF